MYHFLLSRIRIWKMPCAFCAGDHSRLGRCLYVSEEKMKNRTSLVIMAAGIGSRFGGGIKQLTSFGPNGEIIMDYSIYDALSAGFDRIIFVIRRDLEEDFRAVIGSRIEKHADIAYAFQELTDLPAGCVFPEGRTKPWGTGQAILACRSLIDEPFAVINADDYYGPSAFRLMHSYLQEPDDEADKGKFRIGMAGFILKNTLSEFGGVTRGICHLTPGGELAGVTETRNIMRMGEKAVVKEADGSLRELDPESLVSMNFWGFYPDFMDHLADGFTGFLQKLDGEARLKGEYLLPTIVDELIRTDRGRVSVRTSSDQWFGVTYKEDVPAVRKELAGRIAGGLYPQALWEGSEHKE